MPYLRRYSPTNLCDGAPWQIFDDFLRPAFAAGRVQHLSDLHLKFALRPHLGSMADTKSATAEIRRGKKERWIEEDETTG